MNDLREAPKLIQAPLLFILPFPIPSMFHSVHLP